MDSGQQDDAVARFRSERQDLIDKRFKISQDCDKAVLAVASGSLAISLTFMEKVQPNPLVETKIFLGLGWVLLVVAVGVTLAGMVISQQACSAQIDIKLQRLSSDPPGSGPVTSGWALAAAVMSWSSMVLLVAGLLSLVYFCSANYG